ncbi:hypothetical protein FPQ18DRAFT_45193 [Pyronema domesticum]|nr:hypothetical protein FPQ18DRAFT_45193 [Pyronema domesticum]
MICRRNRVHPGTYAQVIPMFCECASAPTPGQPATAYDLLNKRMSRLPYSTSFRTPDDLWGLCFTACVCRQHKLRGSFSKRSMYVGAERHEPHPDHLAPAARFPRQFCSLACIKISSRTCIDSEQLTFHTPVACENKRLTAKVWYTPYPGTTASLHCLFMPAPSRLAKVSGNDFQNIEGYKPVPLCITTQNCSATETKRSYSIVYYSRNSAHLPA